MFKFVTVVCFVMAALCAVVGGFSLSVSSFDFWQAIRVCCGFLIWSAVFYKAGGYFHRLS